MANGLRAKAICEGGCRPIAARAGLRWIAATMVAAVMSFASFLPARAERESEPPGRSATQRGVPQRPVRIPTRGVRGEIGPLQLRGNWGVRPEHPRYRRAQARRLPTGSPESKKWDARLTLNEDRTVTGELNLDVGNRRVRRGDVRARAERGHVWGEIVDENGEQVVTFDATVTPQGVEGTFTTSDDETGTFVWDGELPVE